MTSWFGISSVFWTVVIAVACIVFLIAVIVLIFWFTEKYLGKKQTPKENTLSKEEAQERLKEMIKRGGK